MNIERKPWECPRCHTINAPHVDACGCKPSAAPIGLPTSPQPWTHPILPYSPIWVVPYRTIQPEPQTYPPYTITCGTSGGGRFAQ